ncbi:MAG: energy transducer TonB, partial [Candidatus Acidiferrum sp.]
RKVIVGQLISRVDPQPAQFPPVPGSSVRVQATISEDGRIGNVRPLLGQPNLLPAVVQAIREWRFQPTLVDNKPVKTQCYVVIQFHAPLYTSAKR